MRLNHHSMIRPWLGILSIAAVLGLFACGDDTAADRSLGEANNDGGEDAGGWIDTRAQCSQDDECESGVCEQGRCVAPSCDDGVKNGDETGVDCGGSECAAACSIGDYCESNDDCESGFCLDSACAAPTCDDEIKNAEETDLDCGGPECPSCGPGQVCDVARDCASGVCRGGACEPPKCDDGVKNGEETAIDCGGSECAPCAIGETCEAGTDCLNGVCEAGTCAASTCSDGTQNGDETDTDCGGSCPSCPDDAGCSTSDDCQSGVCDADVCVAASCDDGVRNGDESDTDCGGSCDACQLQEACDDDDDCASGVCGGADGATCVECDTGDTRTSSIACGHNDRGTYEQVCDGDFSWSNDTCEGEWFASCQDHLNADASAADGTYTIDPDGPSGALPEMDVVCDMTTDDGGWTRLTPQMVKDTLTHSFHDYRNNCSVETWSDYAVNFGETGSCNSETAAHLSITLPFGYTQFYLEGFESVEGPASGTWEIDDQSGPGNRVDDPWGSLPSTGWGDVTFGSLDNNTPTASYADESTTTRQCSECTWTFDGNGTIYDVGTSTTDFTIAAIQAGSDVGEDILVWTSGYIWVR